MVEALETASLISLGGDVIATARKATRGGVGGTSNPYASGFNMAARALGRAFRSPTLFRQPVAIGDRVTPVAAVFGAFTGAYNATIDVQCRLGLR